MTTGGGPLASAAQAPSPAVPVSTGALQWSTRPVGAALPPSEGLPGDCDPAQRLPDVPAASPQKRRVQRRRRHGADALWIPPVSHLPSLETVVETSRKGAQLLSAGVAVTALACAAFLAWDLWGSNFYAAHEQATLEQQLDSTSAAAMLGALYATEQPEQAPAPAPQVPAPAPAPAPAPQILIDTVSLADGSPVGRITIPKIGVDETFVYGTDTAQLNTGPGLWKWGVAPGQPGNAFIAGHRTTYGAPFHDIDKLTPGDRITVQVPGQPDAVFEVRGSEVVDASAVEIADQTGGVRLTLAACHPLGSARQRIVVQAELVEGANVQYAQPADGWAFQS